MVILIVISRITTMRVWLTYIVDIYTIVNSVVIMIVLIRSIMSIDIVIASIVPTICINRGKLTDTTRTITIIIIILATILTIMRRGVLILAFKVLIV